MADNAKVKAPTKKENFEGIRQFLEDNGKSDWADVMAHEIELLERKISKGNPVKTAEQNDVIEKIKDVLFDNVGKPMRVSEMLKYPTLANYTSQKLSAMLSKMIESGDVTKTVDKKVAYFSIA